MKPTWVNYVCPDCKRVTKQRDNVGISCMAKLSHKRNTAVTMVKK